MENDNLREEAKEEETSSQEETEEEETFSQEETEEEETSSQEETEEETSSQEETEEETSNEENYYDPEQSSYEAVLLNTPDSLDTNDYSSYFENLQSLGVIITAFILGLGLALAFVLGFKKNE